MDRKWWTLIAVCLGTFMLLIDVTIVNVALPDIQKALRSSFSDLQWVIDAYSLMLAALLLTTGSLADLFGRRRVFVIGLCIFTLSSLLSGIATTPLFLNLARGAQGIGGAAMFSTSLALLATSFRGRERGVAFGVWGAITGLAVAIGPVVGGALTTGLSWRWIFLVNVPIGVICVGLTLLRVEESRQPGAHRPDWIGAITFSGALAALVYALIQGNSKGWGSTEIVACLGGSAVLLLVFLIAERIQRAPMFDLRLFRNPTFSGGSITAFALSAGMFALLLYLTLYLQDVLGFTALESGLRLLLLSGGILLTSTIAGRRATRVPVRLLIGPGLIMVGVGLILMRGLKPSSGWEHLIPGFIVGGAGVGLINPPLASTAVGVVEPARAGMASGINSTFRQVGIATGIAGLGAVFSHTVRTKVVSLLTLTAGIDANHIHALATSVAQGTGAGSAIAAAPASVRPAAILAVRTGFVDGLNELFLIGAVVSFAAAALALVLIRNKDFEASAAHGPTAPAAAVLVGPDPIAGDPEIPVAPEPTAPAAEIPVAPDPAAPDTEIPAAPEPTVPDTEIWATPHPTAAGTEVPAAPEPTAWDPEVRAAPAPEAPPPADDETTGAPEDPPAPASAPTAAPTPTVVPTPAPALAPDPPGPPAGSPEAILAAVEQAAADSAAYVERAIGRELEADRRRVETVSGARDDRGPARAGRAGALRGRLQHLDEERRRLAQALVVHTDAVEAHTQATLGHAQAAARHAEGAAETRRELYRLIAALGAVTAEADAIGGSAGAEESPNGAPTPAGQAADAESATPRQTAPGRARFAQPND